jgi:hypothetical protein
MKKFIIFFISIISMVSVSAQVQKYHVEAIKLGKGYQSSIQWNNWSNPKSQASYVYIDKEHNRIWYQVDNEVVFTFYIRQRVSEQTKNNIKRVVWSTLSMDNDLVTMWHFTKMNQNKSALYIYYDSFGVCLGLNKLN